MNQEILHVLLVEDSPTDAQLVQHVFFRAATGDWSLLHVERLEEAIAAQATQSFDVALLDLSLPDSSGLDTISQFNEAVPDVPIVILTMVDDEELAIQAMAQGAQDYLVKDQVTPQLLRRSIRYAIERSQILQQLRDSEQATLQALEKERELNQLKSYFVSMVSHEFRNPLSALRVMSELLFYCDEGLKPEKRENYIHQINATIDQMCQLLDEVILLGKVETGHFEIDRMPLNLQEFCEELIDSIQFSHTKKHSITLNCQLTSQTLDMDANILRHILMNLISNAIKYSPSDQDIRVDIQEHGGRVHFRICDRGIGIPKDDQSKLFQTFSRCSNVGKIQGTGLGLAIVKRCVDLYQGEIHIESAIGAGTEVTVALPINTP